MIRVRASRVELIPDLSKIEREFINKFSREMTPEEKRLYQLTKDMLEKPGFLERRTIQLAVDSDRRHK